MDEMQTGEDGASEGAEIECAPSREGELRNSTVEMQTTEVVAVESLEELAAAALGDKLEDLGKLELPTPMDEMIAREAVASDGVGEPDETASDVIAYDASSSDEEEAMARIAESGFGPGQEPTVAESRLLKGRRFYNWQEFDNALDEYEASSGTVVKRIYRSKTVFTGRCRGWLKDHPEMTCKMELCARLMKKTGLITVRKVYLIHSCTHHIHNWRNGRNRARWVAKKVMRIVKINRDTSIEQLQSDLKEYHMAESKQWSVQRARMACREKLGGGHKESFSQIPAYALRLQYTDPAVHVVWGVSDSGKFERIFVAPSSSQHAFQFCRPIVGLDGTHTSGDYPMIVLLATCYDGENQSLIMAWAVVSVENNDNWTWFLKELRASFPTMIEPPVVFISDRDKGLNKAVAEVFPGHLHSYCVQHILSSIKAITDADCVAYFEKVVAAQTQSEYDELLSDFKPQSERQYGLIPYVRKLDPSLFARHAFPAPRFGQMTSNIGEVVNAAIKPHRKLPALLLCHEIWLHCMENHFKRKQHADGLPMEELALTSYANDMLEKLSFESRSVRERTSSLDQALMVDRFGSYALRLAERHCDCMDWQEMQFPCSHVISFESTKGRDPRQHAHKYWQALNYKETYRIPMAPFSIDRLDKDPSCGEPEIDPEVKIKRNRKKQRCPLKQLPTLKDNRKARKQNQKCSGCKNPGHNLRRCPFVTGIPRESPQLPQLKDMDGVETMATMAMMGTTKDLASSQMEPRTVSYTEWWSQRHTKDHEEKSLTQVPLE